MHSTVAANERNFSVMSYKILLAVKPILHDVEKIFNCAKMQKFALLANTLAHPT